MEKKINKYIDKIRAIELKPLHRVENRNDLFISSVEYDIKKLKRLSDDDVAALVFEKTLQLYPFAIVEKRGISRLKASGVSLVYLWLPLAAGIRLSGESGESK